MIRKPERFEMIPGEEPFRMFVRLNKDAYLVDLFEYSGNGFCGCVDFEMVRMPLLRRGVRSRQTQCKHIHAAYVFIGEKVSGLLGGKFQTLDERRLYLLGVWWLRWIRIKKLSTLWRSNGLKKPTHPHRDLGGGRLLPPARAVSSTSPG